MIKKKQFHILANEHHSYFSHLVKKRLRVDPLLASISEDSKPTFYVELVTTTFGVL